MASSLNSNSRKIVLGLVVILTVLIIIMFLMLPRKSHPPIAISSQPDVIREQEFLENAILADYANGNYTLQDPYIVQDPYGNSPLTALVLFETPSDATVTIVVKGKDEYSTLTYQFDQLQTHHEVPIVGLYPGTLNEVEISTFAKEGTQTTQSLTFQTEELPYDLPKRKVVIQQPELMEPGWTLINSETYKYFLDMNGDVRWFLNFKANNILRILPNGNLLTAYLPTPPFTYGDPPEKLVETNLLGKFSTYYFTPLIHHDIIPYANSYQATVGDSIYQFDQLMGTQINNSLNLFDLLPTSRTFAYIDDSESLHTNALVTGDDLDDNILVSARNQHALALVNPSTNSLEWIMGTPIKWPEEYQAYLFQPVGDDFEWFWMQHAPQVLPDMDKDPDTIDIVLFDNGTFRDDSPELAENKLYSRMVHYRLDLKNHTIEQIWEYGKGRGFVLYSSIKSSATYLPETGNYLGTFAEVQSPSNEHEFDGVIVEVNEQKVPVYEVRLLNTRRIYRSERVKITDLNLEVALGKQPGIYLENDYPYTVYQYPQVANIDTALDYNDSFYHTCIQKYGDNCLNWIKRAVRYGLIKSNFFPLPVMNIEAITMINNAVHIQGEIKIMEEQKPDLYMMLSNETETLTFDISSAMFSEPDFEGITTFYVNYFDARNIPPAAYEISFFALDSEGFHITYPNTVVSISSP